MFSLETVKGRYITSTLELSQLLSSGAVTDSYFANSANLEKVLVKLESTQGSQEILINFSVPEAYSGSGNLNSAVYVSPNARDSFQLDWVILVDKQGGKFTIKASQLQNANDFAVTFISTEIDNSVPNGQATLPGELIVTPGVYQNVTVDFLGRVVTGTNPSTLVGYGITDAVKNSGGVTSVQSGTDAERSAISSPAQDAVFLSTDTGRIYMYVGNSWISLGGGDTSAISAAVASESSARQAADTQLSLDLANEVTNRTNALSSEASARQSAISSLQSDLSTEVSARSAGDSATLASAESYTDTKISDLINGAPATLDTLKEIATQLANDESAATAVVNALSSEASARQSADSSEASARSAADAGLQSQINNKADSLDLSSHSAASFGVHGVSGSVVGTSDVQSLSNKTIDAASNTISNLGNANLKANADIAHSKMSPLASSKALVSDSSGVVSASLVTSSELGQLSGVVSGVQSQLDAKASSASLSSHSSNSSNVHGVSGSVVGTSDVQTLTNKTIDASSNSLSNISNANVSSNAGLAHSKMAPLTASKALVSDASGVVVPSTVTSAELAHLVGVTSDVQSQLDAKASSSSLSSHASTASSVHGVSGSVVGTSDTQTLSNKTIDAANNTISNLSNSNISSNAAIAHSKMATVAASKALVSDASGIVGASSVTSTELGYVSGVTSAIQTQLNSESSARSSADTTLQTNITNEASARATADTALQSKIDGKAAPTNFMGTPGTAEAGTTGFVTYSNTAQSKPVTGV